MVSHKRQIDLAKNGKKECSNCHKIKDLSAFGNMKTNWDGLMRECRECRTKMHREYYNNPENHEKHKEYIRNYFRNYSKRIPVIERQLKKLFVQGSRALDEFIETTLFQDILKMKGIS
jgi:hypothetical protein